jgi:hypothetical protein
MQALLPFSDETETQRAFRESMLETAKAQARAVLAALDEAPDTVLAHSEDLDDEFEDDLQQNGERSLSTWQQSLYIFDDQLLS